ncbi:putative reverse transcriptase domain-containing protein [Tanacetum coccineum]
MAMMVEMEMFEMGMETIEMEENGNGNPNENGRGDILVARVYTYQDFMKCQPLNFKGTKGVVGLTRWFEKMETVFHISNCPEVYQVKYATCTLLDSALTWWNSHKRTIGVDVAFAMTWRDLMKLMTEVYCPRNEIQKMETELWNLTVKNNDLAAYTQRFQELTLLCTRMVPGEEDRIESLKDQKLKGYAIRSAENKRKFESNQRDPQFKRQNIRGLNVIEPIRLVCRTCGKIGHLTRDCKPAVPAAVNQRDSVVNQRSATCFKCGRQGNFKKDCPKLKKLKLEGKLMLLVKEMQTQDPTLSRLGSFDVIIGMDWLSNNHAMIVYDEKIVRIPFGDKILIVRGDWSDKGKKSTLSIISCTKTQKYMEKGCQVFLAQVTKKETEVKSQEKRLKDVAIIWKFPEDFPGLTHA